MSDQFHDQGENHIYTREQAWQLLTEFTQSESLRKHALAVEACMRACSRKYGDGSPDAESLCGTRDELLAGQYRFLRGRIAALLELTMPIGADERSA